MSSSDENKDASPGTATSLPKEPVLEAMRQGKNPARAEEAVYKEYFDAITSLPTETVLEQIRQGMDPVTNAVANFATPEQRAYRKQLVEGGLISIVLGLLKRCGEETLAEVIGEAVDAESRVNSPGVWVTILANALGSDCPLCIEVAESIEPLIKCMRDDKTRVFFKSTEDWAFSYPFSMALLMNIVNTNPRTLDALLEYEGFLEMIIQCLFWEEKRPDVMADECVQRSLLPRIAMVKFAARRILYSLCVKICGGRNVNQTTEEEKKELYRIGITPIVSEAYDSKCEIPFVLGLLDLVEAASDESEKGNWYSILGELAGSECVDRNVIRGIINLGSSSSDPLDAEQVPRLLYRALTIAVPGGENMFKPVDARYGAAIDAGLFPMCFKLLLQFGDVPGVEICNVFHSILHGATAVAFHPKTSKAIANVRSQTLAECQNPKLQRLKGNAKCNGVLEMLAFFAKDHEDGFTAPGSQVSEAVSCNSCSKMLEKNAIKRCSRCKQAVYCSRECQASDWKGHKRECKAINRPEIEHTGLKSPLSKRDKAKTDERVAKIKQAGSVMFRNAPDTFSSGVS